MLRAWRGNVRELFQCVREAASLVIGTEAPVLRANHLEPQARPPANRPVRPTRMPRRGEKELQSRSNLEDRAASEWTYHPIHEVQRGWNPPPRWRINGAAKKFSPKDAQFGLSSK